MTGFLLAVQFLTIIPVAVKGKVGEGDLARSMAWFPLVGALMGLSLAGTSSLLATFFAPGVVAVALALLLAIVTGGMHLDGVADCADAVFSGRGREERLKIMKDSRVGAMGAAGVAFAVVMKVALIASLSPISAWKALILFPVAGRCAVLLPAFLFPYGRDGAGTGRPFVSNLDLKTLLIACVPALVAATWLMQFDGTFAFLGAGAVAVLVGWGLGKLLGGVTGDVLGVALEAGEMAFLAVVLGLTR